MYIKYGNLQHDNNTVNLASFSHRNVFSKRGLRQTVVKTMRLGGFILGTTQAAIKAAILAVESGYASDGFDAALYHDDGTVSSHFLDTATSLGGVKVLSFNYDKSDGAEYATQRSFSIVLEADYSTGQELLSFEETLSISGTGGQRFVYKSVLNGTPVKQLTHQQTIVRATQSGRAMGLLAYPAFPPPIWPGDVLQDRIARSQTSPEFNGKIFMNWPISWSYPFEGINLSGTPHRK